MARVKSLVGLHRLVDSHLHCQGCDYDLFGLRFGGKCPECGLAIRPPVGINGSIDDAPIAALKRMRTGVLLLLAATAIVPMAIGSLFLPTSLAIALLALAMLSSASWVYGVFILTSPTPGHPDEELDPKETSLRVATRALTASWLLVLGVPLAWRIGVPFSPIAMYLVWLCAIIATGAGFSLLSISVARLAAWANDPDLGHHLRTAAVAVVLVFAGIIFLTALSVLGVNAGILLFFYVAGFAVAIVVAIWNTALYLRLAALLVWAPANAQRAMERARARGERIAQRMTEAESKAESLPPFNVVKPPLHCVLVEQSRDAADEPVIDLAPDDDAAPTPPTPPQPAPGASKINQPTTSPLPPLPKKKPAPPPSVNRKKDEMI